MRVELSRRAETAILAIWDWNEERYGAEHADRYTDWLREQVLGLGSESIPSRPVSPSSIYRYVELHYGRRGHGHIVVFRVKADAIRVIGIFHTAQDWRARLEEP